MTPSIFYLGRNNLDHTLTFTIGGARWEYFLPSAAECDRVEYIIRKASPAKALPQAKRLALKAQQC